LASPKSRPLASLSSKSSASPSICDSAEKTTAFRSDVVSGGRCATDFVGRLYSDGKTCKEAIGRLVCRFLLISLRLEDSGADCYFIAERSPTCFGISSVAAVLIAPQLPASDCSPFVADTSHSWVLDVSQDVSVVTDTSQSSPSPAPA